MSIQPSTISRGFKNECCKKENELEWINGDGIEWEEYLCNECNLSYIVPLERILSWNEAELVERSLKDEIKKVYRFPLIKKG